MADLSVRRCFLESVMSKEAELLVLRIPAVCLHSMLDGFASMLTYLNAAVLVIIPLRSNERNKIRDGLQSLSFYL